MKRLLFALSALLLSLPGVACAQTAVVTNPPVTVGQCPSWTDIYGTAQDSGVGCANHQVTISDGTHGTMVLAPTNAVAANAPAILNNNTIASQPVYLMRSTAGASDVADFTCRRDANYTGGTFGWVNTCFTVYGIARAGSTAFEWPFLARLDNYGMAADLSQNTAGYVQARKFGTASTFAFVSELYDLTANPTTGSITDEHDMSAFGTDASNNRVMLDFFARNGCPASGGCSPTGATEVAWGMRFNTDAYTTIKNGITFNTGTYINGINFAPATITSAAIILGDGHAECYDTACLRKKFFSAGVTYQSVPTLGNVFSWSDAGQFTGVSLNSSGGDLLFGGLTSSYPMLRRNAAAVDVKLADNSAYANLTAKNLLVSAAGGNLCLDGVACLNGFSVAGTTISTGSNFTSSGNVTGTNLLVSAAGGHLCLDGVACLNNFAVSGSTISTAANLTITGSAKVTAGGDVVSTGGNVQIASGKHYCLNVGCTNFIFETGGRFAVSVGGTTGLTLDSSGNVVATGSFSVGFNPGVSCSGVTAATVVVVGGIVTHC